MVEVSDGSARLQSLSPMPSPQKQTGSHSKGDNSPLDYSDDFDYDAYNVESNDERRLQRNRVVQKDRALIATHHLQETEPIMSRLIAKWEWNVSRACLLEAHLCSVHLTVS